MKIAHICLSNWYVDGWSYQENELISRHRLDGHTVCVIASTEVPDQMDRHVYLQPSQYIGSEGAQIVRLPYRNGPKKLMRKLRMHPGVYGLLKDFQPDAILFHGTCGHEVITVARYVRDNPNVIFYIDSHGDQYNSARTFVSREILHKIYYRFCLSRAWPTARKILCVSTEAMAFVKATYQVPDEKIEFYPLGGHILSDSDYLKARRVGRSKYGVSEKEILFLQAGKQTRAKKLIESLRAFTSAPSNAKFVIAGSIDPTIEPEAMALINANANIQFLGWQSAESMTELLCAADVYLQPGTQSVTMQKSICCRCVLVIANVQSHQVFMDSNGWLVESDAELASAIHEACDADLSKMSERSLLVAKRLLDYEKLSKRVLR